NTMRFGLPAPSLIVPVTSRVVVSMTDTESPLVFVTYRLAAAAGAATARTMTSASVRTTDITRASLGRFLRRRSHDAFSIAVTTTSGGDPRTVNRTASPAERRSGIFVVTT